VCCHDNVDNNDLTSLSPPTDDHVHYADDVTDDVTENQDGNDDNDVIDDSGYCFEEGEEADGDLTDYGGHDYTAPAYKTDIQKGLLQ